MNITLTDIIMRRTVVVDGGADFSGINIVKRVNELGENHMLTSHYFADKSR